MFITNENKATLMSELNSKKNVNERLKRNLLSFDASDTGFKENTDSQVEDMENSTETPTIEKKNLKSVIFTTPCGTTWRQLSTGATWFITSPFEDDCHSATAALLHHVTFRTQKRCVPGGKWSGEWGEPNRQVAGSQVEKAIGYYSHTYCTFCCGFLNAGHNQRKGEIWFEYSYDDAYQQSKVKTNDVYLARLKDGAVNDKDGDIPPPEYRIISWYDARSSRKNGWYDNGDSLFAPEDDFIYKNELYTAAFTDTNDFTAYYQIFNTTIIKTMGRIDFLREKVKRSVVIIDNEYRRRWDYIPLRDNVEDYSCSVTFELTNPTDYEEFQGLCNYVEAHSNHDGKIRIRTTDNFTCRVRIQFAADSDYTEYSIKLGMAVLVPASARGWN